jgi:hypothetical protein
MRKQPNCSNGSIAPYDTPKAFNRYLKKIRTQRREFLRQNPTLARTIRRMSDEELTQMETELLEAEVQRLRFLPQFARDPELQAQVTKYEYSIRSNYEGAAWAAWAKSRPRKSRERFKGSSGLARAQLTQAEVIAPLTPQLPTTLAAVINPFSALPQPKPTVEPPPNDRSYVSKFFHNGSSNPYDVW